MPLHGSGWRPKAFVSFSRYFGSALSTALVETDQGLGYLKGLGNREGPHALACEFVGSCLADWLGLPTLDFALLEVKPEDEIPTGPSSRVAPGPAFISRSEPFAFAWGGDPYSLANLSNAEVISQLVVVDTWLRNCDRCAPDLGRRNRDNVLLLKEPHSKRALRLIAMDFTHAFTCGNELSRRLGFIEYIQDTKVYGLFPEFNDWLDRTQVRACADNLGRIDPAEVEQIVAQVPREWEISSELRHIWIRHIFERARFLARNIEELIWAQRDLLKEQGNGN